MPNSSNDLGCIVIFFGGLICWGLASLLGISFGVENEGYVKYSDCRTVVNLKNDSLEKYFHKFTCNYTKTKSGQIMYGECVHTDTSGSLLSTSSDCEKAYVYEAEPSTACENNIGFTHLGYDDLCHSTFQ